MAYVSVTNMKFVRGFGVLMDNTQMHDADLRFKPYVLYARGIKHFNVAVAFRMQDKSGSCVNNKSCFNGRGGIIKKVQQATRFTNTPQCWAVHLATK